MSYIKFVQFLLKLCTVNEKKIHIKINQNLKSQTQKEKTTQESGVSKYFFPEGLEKILLSKNFGKNN